MPTGVARVPRTAGVRDGRPLLEDGRTLGVANVIWCTGFEPGFSWIDLPVFDGEGRPVHTRGVVHRGAGAQLRGTAFPVCDVDSMIHGVGRDAEYLAERIAQRRNEVKPTTPRRPVQAVA